MPIIPELVGQITQRKRSRSEGCRFTAVGIPKLHHHRKAMKPVVHRLAI
jgi:hypothetical protein